MPTQNPEVAAPLDSPLSRAARRFHRRRVLVDRQLQIGLAVRASLFTFSVITLISIALFLPLVREMSGDRGQSVDVDTAIVLLYLHERFWPLALGAVLLSALLSILTSHRIAGPLVRVKRNLWAIARGEDPGPLKTRDRDFMKDEVAALNAATEGIRSQRKRLDTAFTELRSTVDEFRSRSNPDAASSVRISDQGALSTISERIDALERELRQDHDRLPASESATTPMAAQVAAHDLLGSEA